MHTVQTAMRGVLWLGLAAASGAALAQERGGAALDGSPLAFWVGHAESDNISRTNPPQRGDYQSAGVTMNAARAGARVQAGVDADLERRVYGDDAFEAEQVGTLQGYVNVGIVPNRFDWNTQESYGQTKTDPFQVAGPSNRESFSVLSTGPVINLPLGARTALEFGGTYADRRYGDSDLLDGESVTYDLGLYRQISTTARVGLNGETSEVRYGPGLPSYRIDSIELSYDRQLASGGVVAEIGENELRTENGDFGGTMVRVRWDRALTERSRLTAELGKEFIDAGELFGTTNYQIAFNPLDVVLTSSPLQQERIGLMYDVTFTRTTFTARVSAFDQEYELAPSFDNESRDLYLRISRALTPRLDLGISFEKIAREYTVVEREDRDSIAQLSLDRQLGARFALQLYLERAKREGTQELEERLYEIRFVYLPRVRRGN